MAIRSESLLKNAFIEHVTSLAAYLRSVKKEFDAYDRDIIDDCKKICMLNERKQEVFQQFNRHFDAIWNDFQYLSREDHEQYKKYYEREMVGFLGDGIETNSYIRRKPLGYAGDYVTMNFIYDFHVDRFLGKGLYQKLINHYTCNIDVANSNIFRKNFLKDKLLEYSFGACASNILSVGCGPAREIIELLREGKLKKPITIHLLDLEKNAIEFVKGELENIPFDRDIIKIKFHMLDLIEIVKAKKVATLFKDIDFVYISGVFDYLSDRLSKRVVRSMLEITKKELVIFNMSLENARHRAYYEIFGEWVMYHRKREAVASWVEQLDGAYDVQIQNYPDCKSYWILRVERK